MPALSVVHADPAQAYEQCSAQVGTAAGQLGSAEFGVSETVYCVDYTIHKNATGTGAGTLSNPDIGYIEIQLLVTKTNEDNPGTNNSIPGNLQVVGIQAVYFSPDGVPMPPGATATSSAARGAQPAYQDILGGRVDRRVSSSETGSLVY